MTGERNAAIDIMKCLAVLCIFNAHSTMLYPFWPWLSTGGYIGDALFFFCSGYTLFLHGSIKNTRFDTWYKRRLSRIWPSCLAWGLVSCVFWGKRVSVYSALTGLEVGWFITCILLFYILIWLIGKFLFDYLKITFVTVCIISFSLMIVVLYYRVWNPNYWQYPFFFPVMLYGAMCGTQEKDRHNNNYFSKYLLLTIFSFLLFTGVIAIATRVENIAYIRYLKLAGLPLILLFLNCVYRLASTRIVTQAMRRPCVYKPILWIGGLCLDFYLVKASFISGKITFLFPLNLPLMLIYLLLIAYLLRCLGRFIQQTVSDKKCPYEWISVFKL